MPAPGDGTLHVLRARRAGVASSLVQSARGATPGSPGSRPYRGPTMQGKERVASGPTRAVLLPGWQRGGRCSRIKSHIRTGRAFGERGAMGMCVHRAPAGQSITLVIINTARALQDTGHRALPTSVQTQYMFQAPHLPRLAFWTSVKTLSSWRQTEGQGQGGVCFRT